MMGAIDDVDEIAVIESFEAMRQRMLTLVMNLPAAAFQNKRIVDRLQMEVIGHFSEHALPKSQGQVHL